jgi:hypothetical protein
MVTGPGSGDPSSTATRPLRNTGDVMVGDVLVEGVPVVGVVVLVLGARVPVVPVVVPTPVPVPVEPVPPGFCA